MLLAGFKQSVERNPWLCTGGGGENTSAKADAIFVNGSAIAQGGRRKGGSF
jgi:hypothetical protein